MSERNLEDLDRARETVDSLAQHVDTAAAWNTFSSGDPAHGRRSARGKQLAAAVVSVALVASAVGYLASRHTGTTSVSITPTSSPATTPTDCTVPTFPRPTTTLAGGGLTGPAVTALRGGPARAPLDLDGGQFVMTPPRPGDTPTISANQAECAGLASIGVNTQQLLSLALRYGGAVVGYGRVTISPRLVTAAPPLFLCCSNENTSPRLPKPTAYQDRLAWLVVVDNVLIFHGGAATAAPTTVAPAHPGDKYLVFVVDAHTGSDALVYAEAQPGEPPSVGVPAELVSVPWTLVSRSPNGYLSSIRATVLPCDGYPNPVEVDRDRNGNPLSSAAVVVQRPVGATCGPAKEVTVALLAGEVTAYLPATIAPDPLGPDVALPSTALAPPSAKSHGVLHQVGDQDNGKTIHINVSDVLAIIPLMDVDHNATSAVVSSDPAVLGPLFPGMKSPVGEFRAWHAGHADLSVSTSACHYPKSDGLPCTGAWIVHVDIS